MSFNRDFAAKSYDLIAKMDDDTAEMFTRCVAYDVLQSDLQGNRRTISKAVSEILTEIQAEVARPLLNHEDSESAMASAALVTLVSKARGDDPFARDKKGRFARHESRGMPKTRNFSVSFSSSKGPGYKEQAQRRAEQNVRVGDFNVTGALGEAGYVGNKFAEKWAERGDANSTTSRMYQRVQAGSQLLIDTGNSTGNAKLRLAGEAGRFFGQYGPQAEQVIGPAMRRTAYRYRGTERTPDQRLIADANQQTKRLASQGGVDLTKDEVPPALRNSASTNAAVAYLRGRLPDKRLADLQQKSGRIPPSEGVILNAEGKIITQSVGYIDDHYLPFNLKNLKGLQGGSYVRTRSSGGLTTEDIYTGLVSGARSITVVSRSGIFTLDFEDDFRGGRRFNDKAAQMVTQYARTLDAVKSEKVIRKPMDMADRLRIREEVEEDMRGFPPSDIEAEIKRRAEVEQTTPSISPTELSRINQKAAEAAAEGGSAPRGQFTPREWDRIKDDPKKRLAAYRSQMIEDLMAEKEATKFRLDGEGYAAAMEAMREQFPYYIQEVQYIHNKDERARGLGLSAEKDSGYVKPRYNRPEGAQTGFYDPSITGSGKISADKTNYQNAGKFTKIEAETEQAEGAAKAPVTGKRTSPAAQIKDQVAQGQAKAKATAVLKEAIAETTTLDLDAKGFPALTATRQDGIDLDDLLSQPKMREQVITDLKKLVPVLDGQKDNDALRAAGRSIQAKLTAMEATQLAMGGSAFDKANWSGGASPIKPYTFDGDEYKNGQDPAVYQQAWQENIAQGGKTGLDMEMPTTDAKLRADASALGRIWKLADDFSNQQASEEDLYSQVSQMQAELGGAPTAESVVTWVNFIKNNPSSFKHRIFGQIEVLERARRLLAASNGEAAKAAAAPALTGTTTMAAPPAPKLSEPVTTTATTAESMATEIASYAKGAHDPEVKDAFNGVRNGLLTGDSETLYTGLADLQVSGMDIGPLLGRMLDAGLIDKDDFDDLSR